MYESNNINGKSYYFKFLIVGDNYVGKSSFLKRLVSKSTENIKVGSNGGDEKQFVVDNVTITTFIYDADGTPEFGPSIATFVGCADGIFLLYSVENRRSYERLPTWLEFLKKHNAGAVVTVVGCKSDATLFRKVFTSEGKEFARINDTNFIETSAYTRENLEAAFRITTLNIYAKKIFTDENKSTDRKYTNDTNNQNAYISYM